MYIFSFFVLLKLLEKTGPKRGPFLTPCADMPRLGKKKCVRIAWSRHEGSRAGGGKLLGEGAASPNPCTATGSGGVLRGLGQSPSRNGIWCILALKSDIRWQQF